MNKGKLLALAAMFAIMLSSGCGRKSDISAPKEWAFEMEKVWEIQQIGEDKLLRPAEPRIADDGTLYIHDFERHLSYIIDKDGEPVSAFAPRGNNEGEVSYYINCFTAGDNVVICDIDKLHFFTGQGEFIKAVSNNLFVRFPLAFKNENEFWVAPGALGDAPEGPAAVTHVNLETGNETIVHEFVLSDDEKKPSMGAIIIGLTPQIKMAFDNQSDRLYFGKNNDTTIYLMNPDGIPAGSFSFTGTRRPISETDKRNHFADADIPEEQMASIIGALPDEMTYYHRIQVLDDLVYLFSAEDIGRKQTGQNVNVFSPDGRHLYHGRIQVENGWHIASPDNLQLARGFIIAIQQDDAGDRKIVKYSIGLPGMK